MGRAVEQMFVGGRQVVANGRVTCIDRDAVMAEIGEEMRRPLTDAERQAAVMIDQVMPVAMAQHRQLVSDSWRPYRYNSMAD